MDRLKFHAYKDPINEAYWKNEEELIKIEKTEAYVNGACSFLSGNFIFTEYGLSPKELFFDSVGVGAPEVIHIPVVVGDFNQIFTTLAEFRYCLPKFFPGDIFRYRYGKVGFYNTFRFREFPDLKLRSRYSAEVVRGYVHSSFLKDIDHTVRNFKISFKHIQQEIYMCNWKFESVGEDYLVTTRFKDDESRKYAEEDPAVSSTVLKKLDCSAFFMVTCVREEFDESEEAMKYYNKLKFAVNNGYMAWSYSLNDRKDMLKYYIGPEAEYV